MSETTFEKVARFALDNYFSSMNQEEYAEITGYLDSYYYDNDGRYEIIVGVIANEVGVSFRNIEQWYWENIFFTNAE